MSEVQMSAGDQVKNSGVATVQEQNGEGLGVQEVAMVPTDAVADPTLDRLTLVATLCSRSSGGENLLEEPLIQRRGDIEEGGEGGEDEEENEALDEIDNILWIKGLAITPENRCKEALKSWSKKDKLFTSRIDRKRKQSSDFQNEVYQLLGFYSVFQGVLLTAVAQSNLLHCNNAWTATLLSALASFVCIIGVLLKVRKIKELEHTIANEEHTRRALVSWQLKLRESGPRFDFKDTKAKEEAKGNREDKHSSWWLGASFLAIAVVLILFSVAFVVSIRQILCNPGRSLLPGN